jgi:hypothetical protein
MKLDEFTCVVDRCLSAFFVAENFFLEERICYDAGNYIALIYRGQFYKIVIYSSQRDGERNCMLGDVGADNGNLAPSAGWRYIRSLLDDPEKTRSELMKRPRELSSYDDRQLQDIFVLLSERFQEITNNFRLKG